MPRLKAGNNASTTLAAAIDAVQTSFTVTDASLFPDPPFRVTVDAEIMEVGAIDRPTNTFSSVTRAVEGTTAAPHAAGASVENRFTAGTLAELADKAQDVDPVASSLSSHMVNSAHVPYAIATGSANTYAITLEGIDSYQEGLAVAVKINVDNTGPSTLNVNGLGPKAIKKPNGNDVSAGNLKAGSVYTLRYNGVNFILQGEMGVGTAQPADVLEGQTFTNDIGEQAGTMPNRGAGGTVTPGTSDIVKPYGYYSSDITILGDADLVAANIKNGVNIFNVTGTFPNDGTAAEADVLSGKTFYSNNATKRTGTMVNNGVKTITPGTSDQALSGYYASESKVLGDADLIAKNIRKGVNVFGVTGALFPAMLDWNACTIEWDWSGSPVSVAAGAWYTFKEATGPGWLVFYRAFRAQTGDTSSDNPDIRLTVDGVAYVFSGARSPSAGGFLGNEILLPVYFGSSLKIEVYNHNSVAIPLGCDYTILRETGTQSAHRLLAASQRKHAYHNTWGAAAVDVVNISGSGYLLAILSLGHNDEDDPYDRPGHLWVVVDGVTKVNDRRHFSATRENYKHCNFIGPVRFTSSLRVQHAAPRDQVEFVQTNVWYTLD